MEAGVSEYVELVRQIANELIEKKRLSTEMDIVVVNVVHQNGQSWIEVHCRLGSSNNISSYHFKVLRYAKEPKQLLDKESKQLLYTEIEKGIEECWDKYQNSRKLR